MARAGGVGPVREAPAARFACSPVAPRSGGRPIRVGEAATFRPAGHSGRRATLAVPGPPPTHRGRRDLIADAFPWKTELERLAKDLRALARRKRLDDRARVRLELTTLAALYAIWKLAESHHLSEALLHRPIVLTAYPFRRPRDGESLGRVGLGHYDLSAGRRVDHDVVFLCHQMLNNHVFASRPPGSGGPLEGIYLTSAQQKRVALYGIAIDDLIGLVSAVAAERPEL